MNDLPTFLKPMAELPFDDGGAGALLKKDQGSVADFTMTCQEDDQWCWAAVAQAVERWQGNILSQAAVASWHIDPSGHEHLCANDNAKTCEGCYSTCRQAHSLTLVLDERNLLASSDYKKLSFEVIRNAIKAQRPLPVRIQWNGGKDDDGHFVCVTGYAVDESGVQRITVYDPLKPSMGKQPAQPQDMKYNDFANRYCLQNSLGKPNFHYDVKVKVRDEHTS